MIPRILYTIYVSFFREPVLFRTSRITFLGMSEDDPRAVAFVVAGEGKEKRGSEAHAFDCGRREEAERLCRQIYFFKKRCFFLSKVSVCFVQKRSLRSACEERFRRKLEATPERRKRALGLSAGAGRWTDRLSRMWRSRMTS